MKYLCFSDLHCDQDAARRLVSLASDADVLIGAGDFANRHQGIHETIDILATIDKPTILVPGNSETADELHAAVVGWESAMVLHGSGCLVGGVDFWGVGGGIPKTPFGNWSYDFDEAAATELLAGCPKGGILVVHSPPIDTVDHDSSGRIRGSQAIKETVEQQQPKLVICGHIHSDWGKQVLVGSSKIINVGPQGILVEMPCPSS